MRVLVTGGGGFLGGAIVRRLFSRGDTVLSYSRSEYSWHGELGVRSVRGDLADVEGLTKAAQGCDAVIHVAAKAGYWGPFDAYHRANVFGTQAVLEACRRAGVSRLVYTSTPSVVHGGAGLEGVDETQPYPDRHESAYSATKAEAEKAVLAANCDSLATVAIRPHLVWGPGDPHLVPRLVARAKAGRLRKIGDGRNLVDTAYVENAAFAHELALDRLNPNSSIAGRAYFIAQGEPRPLWDTIERLIVASGGPKLPKRAVPESVAVAGGSLCELIWRAFRLGGEPPMTRFVAHQLATSHWFDLAAARTDLGYRPIVSFDEGLERLRAIGS